MANDSLNVAGGLNFVYPGFARYGQGQALAMSQFLLRDRTNPFVEQPDVWASQFIRIVSRTLSFSAVATGTTTAATLFQPTNGQNYITMSRQGDAILNGGATGQNLVAVKAKQTQADGTILDDTAPVTNLFGSAEEPYVLFVPDLVVGTAKRYWTITNNTGNTIDVDLTFNIAYLDVGTR
jgi:hypothetical protein